MWVSTLHFFVTTVAPIFSICPAICTSSRAPTTKPHLSHNQDDAIALLKDQQSVIDHFHLTSQHSSSCPEPVGYNATFGFISSPSSNENIPAALALNDMLRTHYASMRDRLDSERTQNGALRVELQRYRGEAKQWKSFSEDLMCKLDRLRRSIAAERSDQLQKIATQVHKFDAMEAQLDQTRLQYIIAADRLDGVRDKLRSKDNNADE